VRKFCRNVAEAGYDGVEAFIPETGLDTDAFLDALELYGLKFIAQHALTLEPDYELHRRIHKERLRRLAAARPRFLSSQTGRDIFTFEQNRALIEDAERIAQETGVTIVHETHRGRFSFAPWITQHYLQSLPQLRLTLDISHWCVVSESLLEDQQAAVARAISRSDHLHARVGHSQGPQVPDPRSPHWKAAVETHLSWWRRLAERMRSEGRNTMTITVEFGPVPYTTVDPADGKPLLAQWDANLAMREMLLARLADLT
jgi:hypothetical protein